MLYPIKAIIFDLDGVIINSNPAIEAFWENWATKEGIQLTEPLIRKWIHGRKVTDTLNGLFTQVPDSTKEQILKSADEFDRNMHPGGIPGIEEFVGSLNHLQIPIGIVTSSHHERMYLMLEKIGIQNLFTHFITAHDVTKGKPHPEPYLKMSERLQINAAECLVFEDAVSGIQSATAAGMYSVGIGNGNAHEELIIHGAKDVIPDFTGIHIHQRTFTTVNGIQFTA